MNRINRFTLVLVLTLGTLAGCAASGQNNPEPGGEGAAEEEVSLEDLLIEGNEALRTGNLDAAQVSFALAVERDPGNIDALYKLGVIHYEKNSLEIAENLLRRALRIDTRHQGSREALGVVMLKQERLEEAEVVLEDALVSRPDAWQVMNALGVINDMRASHTEAQGMFTAALAVVPRSAKVANNLGYSYYLSGDYDAAENHFRDATSFDRDYVHAWSNLALLYSRIGRYREARAAFDKIVATHQAANNLGYLGLLQDNPLLARKELEQAVRLSPSYYEVANENLAALADARSAGTNAVRRARESASRGTRVDEFSMQDSAAGRDTGSVARSELSSEESRIGSVSEAAYPALPNFTPQRKVIGLAEVPQIRQTASRVPLAKRRREARRTAAPFLAFVGFEASADDDEALQTATRAFQEAYGLETDGLVGPRTKRLLRNVAVTEVQRKLLALGYDIGDIDGRLGRRTRQAIRVFQREESLEVNGEPDAPTLGHLRAAIGRASERLIGEDRIDYSSRG